MHKIWFVHISFCTMAKPYQRIQKVWNINVTVKPIGVGALGTDPKGLVKTIGGTGNKRKYQIHLQHSIVDII